MPKVITVGSLGDQSERFREYKKQLFITFDDNVSNDNYENIYVQIEPNELVNHDWLIQNYQKFSHIYCWESNLLQLPNANLFPFGTAWVNPNKSYSKEFGVSHICSYKGQLPGHKLRQQAFHMINALPYKKLNIKTPPRIDSKEIVFDGYQFSVIIENIKKENWFTEKLIDCLLTRTVPIYYGAPNIGNFFDSSYFLSFNMIDELYNILNSLTPEYYYRYITNIEYNKNAALHYEHIWPRLIKELNKYYE